MINKIQKFTDLKAWQEAHKLVLCVYKIAKGFPADEQFALTSQIKRASVSISSNIAEGFSRQTKQDKIHFYHMAHGSVTEVQNQLLIARDVNYISKEIFSSVAEQAILTHKLLTGLIKSIKDKAE